MNKIIVTFDNSQEDVPVLVVAEEGWNILNPALKVTNIITGNKAIEIWKQLKNEVDIQMKKL